MFICLLILHASIFPVTLYNFLCLLFCSSPFWFNIIFPFTLYNFSGYVCSSCLFQLSLSHYIIFLFHILIYILSTGFLSNIHCLLLSFWFNFPFFHTLIFILNILNILNISNISNVLNMLTILNILNIPPLI